MFAVLKTEERKTGILAWLAERKYPPEVRCSSVKVKNGAPFFIVTAPVKRGKIPWDEIVYAAGKCSLRMFFPQDVTPPSDGLAKAFVPSDKLKAQMLFNTAYEVLRRAGADPLKLSLCVVDRKAEFIEKVHMLFPFAGNVSVVTNMTDKYDMAAEEIMKKYGASIFISSDINAVKEADIVISANEEIPICKEKTFVFTMCCVNTVKRCITAPQITLPKEYEYMRQDGICEEDFTCALYELCRARDLADNSFEYLLINGERHTIYKIAQEMADVLKT